MTASKSFKLLPNFALLIVAVMVSAMAGTPTLAHADQRFTLRNGESLKIACPQGSTPVLEGDVVQCGPVCKLEIVNTREMSCDQGGCFSYGDIVSFTVTLSESKGGTVLFEGSYAASEKPEMVRKLKSDFGGSCKLIQVRERSE